MPSTYHELYLTFDDGPVPGVTEFILDTLAGYKIKATFFCIGDNVQKHPHIFKRILAEGHRAGNHTFHHINGWRTSTQHYLNSVQLCATELAKYPPYPSTLLFRPPYGRITKSQIDALKAYKIIMWDVLSADYDRQLSKEACLKYTIRACRSGSIIVFHDSYKAEKNVTFTLPRMIEHFLVKGFVFKSIPA